MLGKTFSHYRIVEKPAYGGMGRVYKVEHLQLGRTVGLKSLPKELSRDRQMREWARYEAPTAAWSLWRLNGGGL
jgi:serine/threonine protein kinase